MTQKKEKTVRRTLVVLAPSNVPVSARALQWEAASRSGGRKVHRVERAEQGRNESMGRIGKNDAYLIDIELTCRGANRHDFTKFVRSYLPEAKQHFITD